MRGLVHTIRALAQDYTREFGGSVADLLRDSMLGCLACLVLFMDTLLLLAASGGGQ